MKLCSCHGGTLYQGVLSLSFGGCCECASEYIVARSKCSVNVFMISPKRFQNLDWLVYFNPPAIFLENISTKFDLQLDTDRH